MYLAQSKLSYKASVAKNFKELMTNFIKYSRTSIIRTPVCHFNAKDVQINEFFRISELSDKNTI